MNKTECYEELLANAKALMGPEDDLIARMANVSSLLYHHLSHINWAGFYRSSGNQLLVGPFQGKPACTPIAYGKGVCGTCAVTAKIQCIANVHMFPGHIACDAASKSEIVVPLIEKDTVIGVLDLDSDVYDHFDEIDIRYVSILVEMMLTHNVCESRMSQD